MGVLFDLAVSTIRTVIIRVAEWIISVGHNFISWPQNPQQNCPKFEERRRIPGIVGAIDCTHIRIKAPKEHKQDFFNRKKHYSINLQAVVNADMMFIDVYCGLPGSLHDSRVFRKSDLYQKVTENRAEFLPNNTFIIGDSAYNVSEWLISPFKNYGAITQLQKDFNFKLSSTRMVIEMAFGLLKNRFRRILHFCELSNMNLIVNLVLAACVLHNICIIRNDETIIDSVEIDDNDADMDEIGIDGVEHGIEHRREALIEELVNRAVLRR